MSVLNKTSIREAILLERQSLSRGEVEIRSKKIFESFRSSEAIVLPAGFSSVALYSPVRGEVDTRAFFRYLRSRSKACLFPKVVAGDLAFYEVRDLSEMKLGSYGIAEPNPESHVSPSIPDVVFVPGVAFSRNGHRLGFGGGYYDRAINALSAGSRSMPLRFIGLAYEFQVVESLPQDSHDRSVDFIVTEASVIPCGGSK